VKINGDHEKCWFNEEGQIYRYWNTLATFAIRWNDFSSNFHSIQQSSRNGRADDGWRNIFSLLIKDIINEFRKVIFRQVLGETLRQFSFKLFPLALIWNTTSSLPLILPFSISSKKFPLWLIRDRLLGITLTTEITRPQRNRQDNRGEATRT